MGRGASRLPYPAAAKAYPFCLIRLPILNRMLLIILVKTTSSAAIFKRQWCQSKNVGYEVLVGGIVLQCVARAELPSPLALWICSCWSSVLSALKNRINNCKATTVIG